MEVHYGFLGGFVGQVEEYLQQARRNLGHYNVYRVRTRTKTATALVEWDHQQVRTIVLQEANTRIMVQHLAENRVQQMVAGDRNLAHTICEVMADTIDYPLFHTKRARCDQLCIHDRNLTVAPSFQKLIGMNILVAQRPLVGNGLKYDLAPQFTATIPEPPRFHVPEPPLRYMYAELNETTSDESSKDDR